MPQPVIHPELETNGTGMWRRHLLPLDLVWPVELDLVVDQESFSWNFRVTVGMIRILDLQPTRRILAGGFHLAELVAVPRPADALLDERAQLPGVQVKRDEREVARP